MFRKTKDLVALDLGAHSIKMMALSRGKSLLGFLSFGRSRYKMAPQSQEKPPKILSLGIAQLPVGTIVDGKIDRPDELLKSIGALADHLGINPKNMPLALALTGYEVMIKKVTLPMMTEEELEKRMTEELGQYVPYPVSEVNIDYEIMGMAQEKATHMDVMLVAAKRDVVDEYVSIIQQTGFDPAVIDVDFFALTNAFEINYGVFPEKSIGLVDIGASRTTLGIIHQGILAFTQDIPMGGQQIDESIQLHFREEPAPPERIKLGGAGKGLDQRRLESVYREIVRGWADSLNRSIEFYHKNYVDNPLDALYVCGGSARIPGLAEFFQQELSVPVEIFNPLTKLLYDKSQFDPGYLESIGPQMAVCAGLGLRQAGEK